MSDLALKTLRELLKHAEAETERADKAEAERDALRAELAGVNPPPVKPFKLTVDLKGNMQRVYHDVTSWEDFRDRIVIKRGDEIIDEISGFEGLSTG